MPLFFDANPQGEKEKTEKEEHSVPLDAFHDNPLSTSYEFPFFTSAFMRGAQKSPAYLTGQTSIDDLQIINKKIEGGISKNKFPKKVGKKIFLYVPDRIALINAVRDLICRTTNSLIIIRGEHAFKKRDVQSFFNFIFSTGRFVTSRFVPTKENLAFLDAIIQRMLIVGEKRTDVLQGSPVWCLTTATGYMCKMVTKNNDILSIPYISKALLTMPKNPDSTEL